MTKTNSQRAPQPTPPEPTGAELNRYSTTAHRSAAHVIRDYSTSFGWASRLLSPAIRNGIEDIYALVRVADEIVDGAAAQAGLNVGTQREILDALEAETLQAMSNGYSANLIVHAFAITARTHGISPDLLSPFFASMRRDLSPIRFTQEEFDAYVYGSAEVVGVMCLHVFLGPASHHPSHSLVHSARRLGAAFQKINFLRDLAKDWRELGRNYFPAVNPSEFTESQKLAIVEDIEADIKEAAQAVPALPRGCRAAVTAALLLFDELTRRLRATSANELVTTRVRVPAVRKAMILVKSRFTRKVMARSSGVRK